MNREGFFFLPEGRFKDTDPETRSLEGFPQDPFRERRVIRKGVGKDKNDVKERHARSRVGSLGKHRLDIDDRCSIDCF